MHPADFARGLSYPFKGFRILRANPQFARYWRVPIALTALALVSGVVLSMRYHDDLLRLLWSEPHGTGVLSWTLELLYGAARVLAFLLSLALATFACVVLSTLIAAPFNDALSEVVERALTGRVAPPFSLARLLADVGRSVWLEFIKLVCFVSVMVPLWLLSWLVPGAGQIAYSVVGALVTSLYFALDYIDWPASRRGLGVRARLALLGRRPLLMLGFGLGVWVCLFLPLINLAFMPMAVAGGTKLFLDLEADEQGSPAVVR